MEKNRDSLYAQLRRKYSDREIQEQIERNVESSMEIENEMAMLPPVFGTRNKLGRKVSHVLCRSSQKGDFRKRAGRNGAKGMAKVRARKAIAYKGGI